MAPVSPSSAQRPWAAVPASLAEPLRDALPAATESVIAAVTREVPAYAVDNEVIAATLRRGVGVALGRQVDLLGTDDEALGDAAAVYEQIGAGEYHAGRGLADLLTAYQIGARAAWQAFSRAGVETGATPAEVALLAEATFAYIDQLSAASIAGYTRAQVADAGRLEQMRSELLARLLAGEAGSERVAQLSAEVHWPLPATVLVLIPRGATLPATVPGALTGRTDRGPVALVSGPLTPALRRWLAEAPEPVAAGLEVPLAWAGRSEGHARNLLSLPGRASVLAVDHLPDLVIRADPDLGAALRSAVLAPFEGVPAARRGPMLDTLRSWLVNGGNRAAVGAALHVHPQTVSYRMDRIREILGDRLDDPESRWELLLALKSAQPHTDA